MAIYTITADLNGGDAVTPNNLLTYKIYDGTNDALIETTGSDVSDPDVTVTGDSVSIQNVNTSAIIFKISSIDEAGNESPLSDAYGAVGYGLKSIAGETGKSMHGALSNGILVGTVTLTVRMRIPENNTTGLRTYGALSNSNSSGSAQASLGITSHSTGYQVRCLIGGGTNYTSAYVPFPTGNGIHEEFYNMSVSCSILGEWETRLNGKLIGSGTNVDGARTPLTWAHVMANTQGGSSPNAYVSYMQVEDDNRIERFNFTEGSGSQSTSDAGTILSGTTPPSWVGFKSRGLFIPDTPEASLSWLKSDGARCIQPSEYAIYRIESQGPTYSNYIFGNDISSNNNGHLAMKTGSTGSAFVQTRGTSGSTVNSGSVIVNDTTGRTLKVLVVSKDLVELWQDDVLVKTAVNMDYDFTGVVLNTNDVNFGGFNETGGLGVDLTVSYVEINGNGATHVWDFKNDSLVSPTGKTLTISGAGSSDAEFVDCELQDTWL